MNKVNNIEFSSCNIVLRDDGILEQRFVDSKPYKLSANDINKFRESFFFLAGGQKRAILSIAGPNGSIDPEAREIDINASADYTLALGLVIQDLPQRLLANFYFKIKKVDYPIKTFKREHEATEWLNQQVRLTKLVS